MKKFTLATILFSTLILGSCGTIEQISIDYLIPADVSFPQQIRRVGVVNNVNDYPVTQLIENDTTLRLNEIARKVTYFLGDPDLATESLAEAIAAENYFDLVAINDSALRANDIHARETMLTQTEVEELTESMDVDLIVALENLLIQSTRVVQFLPDLGMFWGTVDAKVYPTIRLYLPNRTGPMVTVNARDSIFWEDLRYSQNVLLSQGIIPDEELVEEASNFAGTALVKHIVPYWTTDMRYFYGGGSSDMRDAAIYVKENSWDNAYELWKKVYETGKGKKKMQAAYNIALYYEMKDDIDSAYNWTVTALELAREIEKITETHVPETSNYRFIADYYLKIAARKENLSKLIMQMDRF